MDGAEWLALFQKGVGQNVDEAAQFPQTVTVRTPSLMLGGQQWNNLSIVSQPTANGSKVEAQGREINGTLTMRNNAPWQAAIRYLYYNPATASKDQPANTSPLSQAPASILAAGPISSCAARNAGCGGKNMAVSTAILPSRGIRLRSPAAWSIPVLAA